MKTSNQFRLFKRGADHKTVKPEDAPKDQPFYFRFTYRGKAYTRCLETNDATDAQRRAKVQYAEITGAVSTANYQRLDSTKQRSSEAGTLAQICEAYLTGPSEAGATTRDQNVNAIKQLAAGAVKVNDLTPALARRWFETAQGKVLAQDDQNAAASLKRSANSRWAQAKSLFTARCLAHYQDNELITNPDALEAFVKAGDNARFNRIPKQNYNPPSDKVIAATLAAWEKLGDRDLFLAIGHELAFGLRLGEFAQAEWDWHTTRNDYPVIDSAARVKNGTGLIQVRGLDPYYTILMSRIAAEGWQPADGGRIITGTVTYCTDDLFRAVSAWMRGLGWETMKTNHALRAYAGSQIAMKYGIYEAQMFLRHSSVKVTENSYSHFVSKFKPANLNSLPARWAKVAAPVTVPQPLLREVAPTRN